MTVSSRRRFPREGKRTNGSQNDLHHFQNTVAPISFVDIQDTNALCRRKIQPTRLLGTEPTECIARQQPVPKIRVYNQVSVLGFKIASVLWARRRYGDMGTSNMADGNMVLQLIGSCEMCLLCDRPGMKATYSTAGHRSRLWFWISNVYLVVPGWAVVTQPNTGMEALLIMTVVKMRQSQVARSAGWQLISTRSFLQIVPCWYGPEGKDETALGTIGTVRDDVYFCDTILTTGFFPVLLNLLLPFLPSINPIGAETEAWSLSVYQVTVKGSKTPL